MLRAVVCCFCLLVFASGFATAVTLDPDNLIRKPLLDEAIAALNRQAPTEPTDTLIIVDYALHSATPRLFVLDLTSGHVTAYRVAHGAGSDADHDGFLDRFSNTAGSNASPQGRFRIAESYSGKHGTSLRLDGLDAANANARRRAIVIHAADYAEPDMITRYGKLGRSNGCIVFSQAELATFIAQVPRGTLVYVGAPARDRAR